MKIQIPSRNRSPLVKLGVSRQVVIPKKIHQELGLMPGDYLEVKRLGRKVLLTPKTFIEKRIAEGLEDIKHGRGLGPFDTAEEAIRALHAAVRRRRKR